MAYELRAVERQTTVTMGEYTARALPRLDAIEALAAKIDFSDIGWQLTQQGDRYLRLMGEQALDEQKAGL